MVRQPDSDMQSMKFNSKINSEGSKTKGKANTVKIFEENIRARFSYIRFVSDF